MEPIVQRQSMANTDFCWAREKGARRVRSLPRGSWRIMAPDSGGMMRSGAGIKMQCRARDARGVDLCS